MTDTTCPRRIHELGPWMNAEGLDDWRGDGSERTCSFCGSLHPDEFMAAVERGEELIPTDKNYKAYIGPGHRKFYYQHLSDTQRTSLIALANDGKIKFGFPGYWYALPFFVRRAEAPE